MDGRIISRLIGLMAGMTQSLLSLSFNLAGIAAGAFLAAFFNVVKSNPWAFVLYPGILSLRGAIGGLFAGRLSTALHLGTIRPSLFNNTREATLLFDSITALTFISSIFLVSVASVLSMLTLGASLFDVVEMILVTLSTMAVSILFISPLTFLISVFAFRRGSDPDVVVYPIISTVADIILTVCYLLILKSIFHSMSLVFFGVVISVFVLAVLRIFKKNMQEVRFRSIIKEFMITLIFVSVIVNFTGTTLEKIAHTIGQRPEIYAVYPAIIDTVGDVGSMVGSTATTKIVLGLLSPSLSDMKKHSGEIFVAWSASLIMFGSFSAVSSLFYGLDKFKSLLTQLLLVNLIVVPIIIGVSLIIIIATSKRGWDPDNFIIPIESSLSDSITSLAMYIILRWGVP